MEKKDELKDSKKGESKTEKIVYKVVHVPYYYPVPVDAEWYYKHYDKFSKHHEKFPKHHEKFSPHSEHSEHPPSFEHFSWPPPGFPFPKKERKKEYHDYREDHRDYRDDHRDYRFMYEDVPDYRDLRKRSPTRPHSVSPTRSHSISPTRPHSISPVQTQSSPKDSKDANDNSKTEKISARDASKETTDANSICDEPTPEKQSDGVDKSTDAEEIKTERSESPNDNDGEERSNDACSDKSLETTRKRKRYLMTFPYDQRKKKFNENDEEHKADYRFKEEIDIFETTRTRTT